MTVRVFKTTRKTNVITDLETGKEYFGYEALGRALGLSGCAVTYQKDKTLDDDIFEIKGKKYSIKTEYKEITKTCNFKSEPIICYETGDEFENIEDCIAANSFTRPLLKRLIDERFSIGGKHYILKRDYKPNMKFPDIPSYEVMRSEESKRRSEARKRYLREEAEQEIREKSTKPIAKAIYHYSKHQAFPVLVLSDKSVGRTNFKVQDEERTIYYCTKNELSDYERI